MILFATQQSLSLNGIELTDIEREIRMNAAAEFVDFVDLASRLTEVKIITSAQLQWAVV